MARFFVSHHYPPTCNMRGSFLALLTFTALACSSVPAAELESAPLAPKSPAGPKLFSELGAALTGIDFTNPIDDTHPLRYLYASSMCTGGVAIGDFDLDGRPDVFLANGPGENRLFQQTDGVRFKDMGPQAGIGGGTSWGIGCAAGDVDRDGDLDLYVCNYLSANQLFINNGKGIFAEQAAAFGVDFVDACHTPSFCDYDGDGWLDLYILTNRWYRPEGFPEEQTIVAEPGRRPFVKPEFERFYDAVQTGDETWGTMVVGRPDILCHNTGKGRFGNVTRQAGINHRGHGLSSTWFDWTGDGRPDLWIGNDFDEPDRLYVNQGDGTFRDVTLEAIGQMSWFSMGADFGDVNGDGLLDFFITDMSGTTHFKQKTAMGSMGDKLWLMQNGRPPQLMRNHLFLNAGNGRWLEGAYLAGLANSNWSWAARLCDFDNDGRNDVFVQAGMTRNFNEKDDPEVRKDAGTKTQWDRFKKLPPLKETNMAWRNSGGMAFEETAAAWGLDHTGMSFGCAAGDLDGDGDLDLVSVRLDEPVVIYRNDSQEGNRVTFQFKGTASDLFGTGVQARVETASGVQVRELTLTRGYLGSDQPLMHFGLGADPVIRRLKLRWPSGREQVFENLAAACHYTITEPAQATDLPQAPPPVALFAPDPALAAAVHEEKPYDDFAREPLLPNAMSQLGPGHAWGDVNGDGRDDLFLGGARYGSRQLLLARPTGGFEPAPQGFPSDLLSEDMGVLFLDAEGDGDADLYIVSGGVESNAGAFTYQDRLYLNDGQGTFSAAAAGQLPDIRDSGGPVVAADFDRDGDLDIFVGGRCVPGAYPTSAANHLLRNDQGKFTDVTPAGLAKTGMVTGALWSDADGDAWPDLLLTHEWGTILLFHNEKGQLAKAGKTGLETSSGWWNGIAGRDLDGDGDIDYIATNFGRNTKYHPDPAHPALIYYGDMDGSGKAQIVEAEYEKDALVPIRGKSCSSLAMPFIKDKFQTYSAFAKASLSEIYSPEKLDSVQKFSATVLDSALLRNDGKGHFTVEPLPWLAQIAPSFGVVVAELNGDTAPDVVLAQNFFTAQVETGRMAGGLSLLLPGNGKGGLDTAWPDQSGIAEPGDAKSLTVADLNADGRPDLAFGINNRPMDAFISKGAARGQFVTVRLRGPAGNPNGIGALVKLTTATGAPQTAEVHAGSGYLSQSPADLTFGLGDAKEIESITVRWPDGTRSEVKQPKPGNGLLVITQKSKPDGKKIVPQPSSR